MTGLRRMSSNLTRDPARDSKEVPEIHRDVLQACLPISLDAIPLASCAGGRPVTGSRETRPRTS
jgi:hypothetical protein